jgi:hypothetical protein
VTSAVVSLVAGGMVTIENCQVLCTLPADNYIVVYTGQLFMTGNGFLAGYGDSSNNRNPPRISCGPTDLSLDGSLGFGSVISLNNCYALMQPGQYAPLYENGTLLTGPASVLRGTKRSVWSLGDNTFVVNGTVITSAQLQPWFGVTPNVGATVALPWTPPASIPNASVATASTTVGSLTMNAGDLVAVSYSQPLPPGVLLTAAITGAGTVTATLLNMSGAPLSGLAAGTLLFTVQPRS